MPISLDDYEAEICHNGLRAIIYQPSEEIIDRNCSTLNNNLYVCVRQVDHLSDHHGNGRFAT